MRSTVHCTVKIIELNQFIGQGAAGREGVVNVAIPLTYSIALATVYILTY